MVIPKWITPSRLMLAAIILAIGWGFPESSAQETSEQIWCDYNPGWKLSDVTRLSLDAGLRTEFGDDGFWQLVATPGVDYKVNKIKLAGGVGNYFTFNEMATDQWEIRPFQSASYKWPNNRISLDHRVRLEERFQINTDSWDSKNSLRGRYRLRFRYRLEKHQIVQFWSLIADGELFLTLAGTEGQRQEKTRLGVGAERTFKNGKRFRFEVVWQQEGLFYDSGETADVIYFRFRFLRSW